MSQLKKSLQQLSNEKEFYAQGFLSEALYLAWQQTVKPNVADAFVAFIQTDPSDEERLSGLLKKQPALVKVILHSSVMKQIKPWYQQHLSADFKRQKRQQEALVDTLYILCARYKKQLRHTILHYSNGLIGISLEGNLLEKEKNEMLSTHAHLDLTASQNQHLHRALKQLQAIVKLEQTLQGENSSAKKLQDFIAVFQQASVQAALNKRPPVWISHIFQKLTALCQFEGWLASTKTKTNETVPNNGDVLAELTQHIKKIPHCT